MKYEMGGVVITKVEKKERFGGLDNVVIPKNPRGTYAKLLMKRLPFN